MTHHCTQRLRVSRIVVQENKAKATIINDAKERYLITKVDGCLCVNETAADWIIEKEGESSALVVELKGTNVPHGVDQVWATAMLCEARSPRPKRIAGLIVSAQRPSYSTSVQKKQIAFAKRFAGPLRVKPGNKEHVFEALLNF